MIGQYVTTHGDVISHVNITHVMVEDGGEYMCIAENRAGKTQHSARLNVYGMPYIRLIPKVSAIAGETLHLKCPGKSFQIKFDFNSIQFAFHSYFSQLPDGL
jgi:Down syndrome cell adhesion molecule-like protein 1